MLKFIITHYLHWHTSACYSLPLASLLRFFAVFFFLSPVIVYNIIHVGTVVRIKKPKEFDPELKKVALQTMAFAIILSLSLIIF